ncbi:MAG: hypothetical protein HQ592_03595 [Planctomycetes bacterium]|nr:hypothetical protein [Planctomycetota bacterium]
MMPFFARKTLIIVAFVVTTAMVAARQPRLAIPRHFWTMAEQGAGDPGGFVNACARRPSSTPARHG